MTGPRSRLLLCVVTFASISAVLVGCDTNPTPAGLATCAAVASVSPQSARIAVGDNVTVTETLETGCPTPIVRNESPTLLQVDSAGPATILITGLAPGVGTVRIRSGVDTLVSSIVSITVIGQ